MMNSPVTLLPAEMSVSGQHRQGCSQSRLLALLLLTLVGSSPLSAATDWHNNRVLPLEKVTAGPADNHQAQPDDRQDRLYFTRSQHLMARLMVQQLSTGRYQPLLPEGVDAKDPVRSPDGRHLAFTSFRHDALGDVCILPLTQGNATEPTENSLNCLTPRGSREWMPFWINPQQLGYLHHPEGSDVTQLVVQQLDGSRREVLLTGQIASPATSPDGRYLVYQQWHPDTGHQLHLYDLRQRRALGQVQFDLPGTSSYAALDTARGYLYFAHYLNDTSADQRIDAEDHSVIFRIPLQQALAAAGQPTRLQPEQLTSVALNCNFPAIGEQHLYMTCAFEGSLDTYRLPHSGQVPTSWSKEQLLQAHATAASHENRLLLLNVLRQRFPDASPQVLEQRLEQQLSNHLLLGELTAARYYLQQLQVIHQQHNDPVLADFFNNLDQWLQMQAARQQQPAGVLTADFLRQLEQQRQLLQPSPTSGSSLLFQAWFDLLQQRPESAANRLKHWQPGTRHPLETWLAVTLQLELQQQQPEALLETLEQAARHPGLPDNARLYYTFHYLKLLSRLHPDIDTHRQQLNAALPRFSGARQQDLLLNEIELLALGQSTDRELDRQLWLSISQRLRDHQSDPVMRRVMHIRAIQLTGLAGRHDMMELMSRNWLTLTRISEVAFAETAEQYAIISRDRAYAALQQQDPGAALNGFYAVIRQTNDLESLHNLFSIGLDQEHGLQQRLALLYNQLQDENLLQQNSQYAEALRLLMQQQQPQPSTRQLQQAATLLKDFRPAGLDRGASDLLLGSIYHQLLLQSQQGYQYDRQLFQQSNHHYLMGLDLAWNNPRMQAALLENLGRLHFSVRNHGQSAGFFALRMDLPFLNAEEEIWLRWRLARALYHSNRPDAAAAQSSMALLLAQQQQWHATDLLPLQERTAFHLLQAGQHQAAAGLYQELLQNNSLSAANQARFRFNLAYALFVLQQSAEAESHFHQLLQELPGVQARRADRDRLAPFQPRRLELQTYGFLAQLATNDQQQLHWLEQRIRLLEQMQSRRRAYGFDEQGRLELLIRARLQQAAVLEQQQPDAAARVMQQNLKDLTAWQQAGGSLVSQPVLQSLYNLLVMAADHPQAFAPLQAEIQRRLPEVLEQLTVEPFTPVVNQAQQLKLQLLWHWQAFHATGGQSHARLQRQLHNLVEDERWSAVQTARADLHEELEALRAGILARLHLNE